jgi:cystathionine gamma-synthase
MRFETKAIHRGTDPQPETGDVTAPIHLSTTFRRDAAGAATGPYGYIREGSATQDRLEDALAAIDSAATSLFFASGMAAAAALFQALPRGAHLILPDDCYFGVRLLARDFLPRWNVSFDLAPMEDLDAVRALVRKETAMIWAESPSNPLMKIADLEALAGVARGAAAIFVVDGTFATPALQRPIELGADVVLHSATKYLGGHSDVQGGVLTLREAGPLAEALLRIRHDAGAVASPFNAWLVLRGIRSLAARMRVHSENAAAVAAFLTAHPQVEVVHYPGLTGHPGHEIARRQMSAFGGMLSFLVRGSREDALAVTGRTKLFIPATSLGGVESLIEHRESSEGEGSTTPETLLRLSVGLEHADDLIADLAQALG